ncbi:MAG: hypothetical protein QF819_07210 [Gemmatimonadota bacterium]|nr:hypothetical protein [Gemmatimonadota bacterium]MDP6528447.1 hypothetical protein [Gemmatimonadota bacterium]MDP6802948.1 hypothetical protein [Gemmatimonadota bacterium]MDP7031245.1 hypothetical protein [Gemmatimonadota bacterium]
MVRATEWLLTDPGRLDRTVTALPPPAPGEVLVASRLGAISPGSERAALHGSSGAGRYPRQPGSLNVVVIMEAQDGTLVGERGIATLGHRDFSLLPYHRFLRIPPGVPDEVALLGVLAADARHAVDTADPRPGEECLVLGGGILGALTAWEAVLHTRGPVRIVERRADRRALLAGIRWPGEVAVVEDTGRGEVQSAFDCAGSASGFRSLQGAVQSGGSIVIAADRSHEEYVLSRDFFAKGLFLGKSGSHPQLGAFLAEYFARGADLGGLPEAAFADDCPFSEFPHSYLTALLGPPGAGLLQRVVYPPPRRIG